MTERKQRIASKNAELLDAAKAACGVTSDYALAQKMSLNRGRIGEWRNGLAMNNHALVWLALTLNREIGEFVALYELTIAPEKERPFWADFLARIGRGAAVLLVAFTLISGISGSDPGAAGGSRQSRIIGKYVRKLRRSRPVRIHRFCGELSPFGGFFFSKQKAAGLSIFYPSPG